MCVYKCYACAYPLVETHQQHVCVCVYAAYALYVLAALCVSYNDTPYPYAVLWSGSKVEDLLGPRWVRSYILGGKKRARNWSAPAPGCCPTLSIHIRGFDCNSTNYTFRQHTTNTLSLLYIYIYIYIYTYILPEG